MRYFSKSIPPCRWTAALSCAVVTACAVAGSPTAWGQTAAAPVAYVKTVTGSAFIVGAQGAQPATPGMPVYLHQTIRTGAKSTLGLTFVDETILAFGPHSELRVDEYQYAPAEGQLAFAAQFARGTLNYISGVIAKLRPESVTVKTPTGVIGVRGTQFAVKVEPVKP